MSEKRYRVLFVASHAVQYQAPVFRRLAAEPAIDIQVAYCTLKGAEAAHDPEFGASVQWDVPLLDGYPWTHVPNCGSGKESFFGLLNPGLWKLIRKGNYDAVVSYVGYVRATFWITYLASKSCGAAFLSGCDQGSLEPRDGKAWKRIIKKLAWPLLYRLADHVVVSSTSARRLIRSLGIHEERISLTPLVVDNDWWLARSAEINRWSVRQSLGASPSDTIILFCAKLQPWKRPLDLLRAFARAGTCQSFLLIAGEGPLRAELEKNAASLGVSSRVRFLGFVNQSQLPAVYTASDLMVLPSEFEPFGAVVNEAMCCGCVPVASDSCGAARDLVAPVSADLVFPCGDIEALAKILRDTSSNRTRLQALARAALAHIQTWSPRENIARTVDAIRIAVTCKRSGYSDAAPALPRGSAASSTQKLPE